MFGIQQFYEGQNVFITGGTGFMGKILVEKILRGCPKIGKIYLLIRPKKGQSIQNRMKEITKLPMFEPLRNINPDFENKIVPLNGDATKFGLGLSIEDQSLLINEVSIIFHAAAATKFDEPLSVAVPINVNSVMELIKICKECKKLKVAVYVSTAFSQCIHENIEEKIYPLAMTYEEINYTVQIMKRRNLSEEDEAIFTKLLLGKFPNTYVFTKSIAEGLLNEKARDLPFCIFRFPIAVATYKEPVPGWIDSVQGLNRGMMGIGIGALHVLNINRSAILHLVPADFVCNALIASAWETGTNENITNGNKTTDLSVYNYVSDKSNQITWREFELLWRKCRPKYSFSKAFYYPEGFTVTSIKLYAICNFFMHLIPALIGDLILKSLGKKPILLDIYKKGNKLLEAVRFFLLLQWTFETNRVQSMWNKLSKIDQELMPFDMKTVDWEDVTTEYWKGILKYIMKDDLSPEGRKRASRRNDMLYTIHRIVKTVSIILVILIVWKIFSGTSLYHSVYELFL